MASSRYTRNDTALVAHRKALAALPHAPPSSVVSIEISFPQTPPGIGPRFEVIAPDMGLTAALQASPLLPFLTPPPPPVGPFELQRLVLRVEDAQLAALDWESVLAARWTTDGQRQPIMRVSRVQPRVKQAPLVFPLHVLEVGTPRVLAAAIDQTLHSSRETSALTVDASALADVERFLERSRWRAADVLHVHDRADNDDLLSASRGDDPGTLGWILRLAMRWQTRLIVLEAGPASLELVRRLAHEIVDRAGPAVLVADRDRIDRPRLYADVLHDRPLDWIQKSLPGTALFAGAGRTEALRLSRVAERLASPRSVAAIIAKLAAAKAAPRPVPVLAPTRAQIRAAVRAAARHLRIEATRKEVALGWQYAPKRIRFGDVIADRMLTKGFVVRPLDDWMKSAGGPEPQVPLESIVDLVQRRSLSLGQVLDPSTGPHFKDIVLEKLDNVADSLKEFEFEHHETSGTLPMAVKSVNVRNLMRAAGAAAEESPAAPRTPRHVNAGFFRRSEDDELEPVRQAGARLVPREEVHLGIRVGARDELTVTVGPTVLYEGLFPWASGSLGCWIEIGVTPLDFDNLGAPVQEVWLPREGEMQLVSFALSPRAETAVAGAARVRFTLYHRDNIVQSYLVAALLRGAAGVPRESLAAALGVDHAALPASDAGFLARLEYSAADPEEAANVAPRRLSILANDIAGQKVFTIKGQDFFSTNVNANFTALVKNARAALHRASYNERIEEYRFGDQNFGRYEDLLGFLWDIASAGWQLFHQLLPSGKERADAVRRLDGEGVVHAAHVDLGQVVPWALIYDLPIDDGLDHVTIEEGGQLSRYPVPRQLCRAGMPYDERLGAGDPCGKSEDCLLYGADDQGRRRMGNVYYCRQAVVCPRHFWGFAHQIEVPAQQPQPGQEQVRPMQRVIPAATTVRLAVGHNPMVRLAGAHLEALKARLGKKASIDEPFAPARSEILDLLRRVEPDVVYFYCHAWVDKIEAPGEPAPNLDFGSRARTDLVLAADFQGNPWAHRPLVFLNGCGTIGFSPAAPSDFVTSLIQGREASAVIGTEVTVWPELAAEVGLAFLEEFLEGKPRTAGEALLKARRALLLQKYNPLGLVYTLYGSADLVIERSAAR